jgi:hypothetical protein
MGSLRRYAVKDNLIFKVIFQDLERLICPEAVINKNLWFLVRLRFSLGIKYKLKPVQADLRIGIARLGARKMPSRSIVHRLYASIDYS